jgi:hypothetical protein
VSGGTGHGLQRDTAVPGLEVPRRRPADRRDRLGRRLRRLGDGIVRPARPAARALSARLAGHGPSAALALICVAAPFILALGRLATEPAVPVNLAGDSALIELATREASEGARLLGPYSRFGWNHPGPLYFYLLAGPYQLLGGDPRGLHAGVLLLNLTSALAVVAVVWRRVGPRAVPAASAVVLAFALALGPAKLRDLWNPTVIVLPTLLLMVLAAATAAGSWPSLAGAVVVGSFLAQTHVAVAPFVAVALAGTPVTRLAAARRARQRSRRPAGRASDWPRPPPARSRAERTWPCGLTRSRPGPMPIGLVVAAVASAAVAWAPPLHEQATSAGNLGTLARFFVGTGGGHTLTAGWHAFVQAAGTLPFGLPPQRPPPVAPAAKGVALAVAAVAAVAAVGVGARRRARFDTWLGASSLLGGVVAVWLATRIRGVILGYLLYWMAAVPATGLLAGALLTARVLRRGRWERAAVAVPTVVAVALAGVLAITVLRLPAVVAASDAAVAGSLALARGVPGGPDPPVDRGVPGGPDPPVHRGVPGGPDPRVHRGVSEEAFAGGVEHVHVTLADHNQWPVAAGVVGGLVKSGYDVSVPTEYLPMYGPRYAPGRTPDLVLVLADAERAVGPRPAGVPGSRHIGTAAGTAVFVRRPGRPGWQGPGPTGFHPGTPHAWLSLDALTAGRWPRSP